VASVVVRRAVEGGDAERLVLAGDVGAKIAAWLEGAGPVVGGGVEDRLATEDAEVLPLALFTGLAPSVAAEPR
jgi:hypothetical protein